MINEPAFLLISKPTKIAFIERLNRHLH